MKFALFYEIPVARPWSRESELRAYQNTLEQAIRGDELGFHAFWTVEHHFLEEFSHCSNPEVLYGNIAARTSSSTPTTSRTTGSCVRSSFSANT